MHNQQVINKYFDRQVHADIQVFGKSWSTFQVCGVVGFVLSIFLTFILAIDLRLSLLLEED